MKKHMNRGIIRPIALVIAVAITIPLLLLAGCVGAGEAMEPAYEEAEPLMEAPSASGRSAGAAQKAAPRAAPQAAPMQAASESIAADSISGTVPQEPDQKVPEDPDARQRLRIYSADVEIEVTGLDESREKIIGIAEESGGYVESSSMNYVVIRVPAESFDSSLQAVESIGKILNRSVRTADVTEQFSDLQRRIAVAEKTRERLYTLLNRTEDTDERVKILREIRRLTEEIERLGTQLKSLDQQIRFSRIAVRLVSRIGQGGPSGRQIPFPWIANLNPVYTSTGAAGQKLGIIPPDDFAVFEEGKILIAESAAGSRIRAGAVPNEPSGDTKFWAQALRFHLRESYRSLERLQAGNFDGALFESKDPSPFHYLVALQVRKEEIIVAEIFFPHKEELAAHRDQIMQMLEEADIQ